jgi:Uma2 family endonuclease
MIAKYQPGANEPTLPTHKDLPDSDGALVENFLEIPQRIILCDSLRPWLNQLYTDGQFIIGSDSGVYWKITDPPLKGCKAPDWFYVPGVPPTLDGEPRGSYVMWQEKVIPPLLIELVSNDRGEEQDATPNTGKFWVYEQGIQAPYYLIFDWKDGGSIDAYQRIDGRYRPLAPNERGHYAIPPLQCEFGIHPAFHAGFDVPWLRAYDLDGRMLPTGAERAEQEKERADKLAARLRELGIDPDKL